MFQSALSTSRRRMLTRHTPFAPLGMAAGVCLVLSECSNDHELGRVPLHRNKNENSPNPNERIIRGEGVVVVKDWRQQVAMPSSILSFCSYPKSHNHVVYCEPSPRTQDSSSGVAPRKRATLKKAVEGSSSSSRPDNDSSFPYNTGAAQRRRNTAEVLDTLLPQQAEMLKQWERDEDGWRELPARAWPAYQPKPEEMEFIQKEANQRGCHLLKSTDDKDCQDLSFRIATTLVFYNIDAHQGLKQYLALANQGHVDAMVACGVILVEGLGVPPREEEGIAWLQKAAAKGSKQAHYELGTIYYTGIADVIDEDPKKAFYFFEIAAQEKHVAAMYMMADCLAEGEGVEKDVARAVPLFYQAADQGHRFARQRIRELLAEYKKQKE